MTDCATVARELRQELRIARERLEAIDPAKVLMICGELSLEELNRATRILKNLQTNIQIQTLGGTIGSD